MSYGYTYYKIGISVHKILVFHSNP